MKKIVLFIMLMLPVVVSGQKDVTTFLGIPVDGSKDAMIHKLAQKGFKRVPYGKEAVFYQQPDLSLIDTVKVQNEIKEKLKNKFGEQRISNPDEIVKNEAIKQSLHYFAEIICKKSVWFMISEKSYGKYYIVMFYDNEYNHSNGEDL